MLFSLSCCNNIHVNGLLLNFVLGGLNYVDQIYRQVLPLSMKTYNYGLHARKSSSHLTKFLVNSIHIYGSKSIYYENTFHN